MKKELILNMSFPSLNEYINLERSNKFAAATMKKSRTITVAYLARAQVFKLEDKKYDVYFTWYKPNNKKDHDNIAFAKKFVLDGLILAKVLKSDGSKYINNFRDTFILDKTRDYVSCKVEFIELF